MEVPYIQKIKWVRLGSLLAVPVLSSWFLVHSKKEVSVISVSLKMGSFCVILGIRQEALGSSFVGWLAGRCWAAALVWSFQLSVLSP